MKMCYKCGFRRSEADFHKNRRAYDGLTTYCKFHIKKDNRTKTQISERNAKRRTLRSMRFPKWADRSAIQSIYADAREFRDAGLDVHVDHIIPLRAKLASGLHVHNNLTIKLAAWNDSKGNKFNV